MASSKLLHISVVAFIVRNEYSFGLSADGGGAPAAPPPPAPPLGPATAPPPGSVPVGAVDVAASVAAAAADRAVKRARRVRLRLGLEVSSKPAVGRGFLVLRGLSVLLSFPEKIRLVFLDPPFCYSGLAIQARQARRRLRVSTCPHRRSAIAVAAVPVPGHPGAAGLCALQLFMVLRC